MTVPAIHGVCEPRFSALRDAFASNFAKHDEIGAGIAVIEDGRVAVELWAGHMDEAKSRAWQRDTLVNVFSVGKGAMALAALMLVDRGLLDLDRPVCRHWPEFAAAGKETITLRQLLAHQAGLPALRRELPDRAMYDWQLMTTALAAERPWWTPGTRHGYHCNTLGFLVGEPMRRVSGRSVGTFLREELAAPLGADFHIGLAAEHDARVADFVWLPELNVIPRLDRSRLSEEQLLMLHVYLNPVGASGHGVIHEAAWRRCEYPSTNAQATALGIARIFEPMATGGVVGGRRYLSDALLREMASEQASGVDVILGQPARRGLGVQLPPLEKTFTKHEGVVFHYGAGGALGLADPVARLSFGYAMNRMGPRNNNPAPRALVDALYGCIG